MSLDRSKIGALSLTTCLVLALVSCAGRPEGEGTGQSGTEREQPPDEWGDTPGIVTHSEDRKMLFLLDPETGEELDSLRLNFAEEAPDYGFRVSPGNIASTNFSPDFRYMARLADGRERIDLYPLPDQEPVWQHEIPSSSIASTDTKINWVGFSSDSQELLFRTEAGAQRRLHSVEVEGGEGGSAPEEIGSWTSGTDQEVSFGWTHDNTQMHGDEYSHNQEGEGGEIIESEGVRSNGDVLPTYIRIWTDGEMIGPNEEYADFFRTGDGTYIGAHVNRASSIEDPDVAHLIEFTLDGEGGVTEWSELHEAAHIDAFALSPDEEQLAVSKDGDVFLLPADGSEDKTRLDQDENQDHRVLGWF